VFVAVARAVLPAGFFGVLLATIVAIVMSSQESVLNCAAVAFVRDIVGIFVSPSEKAALLIAKLSTLGIAIIAILAAQFSPSIIDGLLLLYSIWAPTILVALIAGLYIKKTRPLASWLSILGGAAVSLGWQFAKEPAGVPAILVGLVASIILYAIGHAFGRPIQMKSGQQEEVIT
jgi:SSS family solute:Na+ symporter